jgi:hypothetical protein
MAEIALSDTQHTSRFRRLTAMKRVTPGLLAITVRTGLMVALALVLILVLLPAALAAQGAVIR